MKVKVGWDGTDRTSIVEIEDAASSNEAEITAFGMSGEFFFEDGGKGSMGFPQKAEAMRSDEVGTR